MKRTVAAGLALLLGAAQADAAEFATDRSAPIASLAVRPQASFADRFDGASAHVIAEWCGLEMSDADKSRVQNSDALGGAAITLFSTYIVCRHIAPQTGRAVPVRCRSVAPVAETTPAEAEGLESLDRWQSDHGHNAAADPDAGTEAAADVPRWRELDAPSAWAQPGAIRVTVSGDDYAASAACT